MQISSPIRGKIDKVGKLHIGSNFYSEWRTKSAFEGQMCHRPLNKELELTPQM